MSFLFPSSFSAAHLFILHPMTMYDVQEQYRMFCAAKELGIEWLEIPRQ